MIEPISTGALLGAGWFANKILGPSADELGEQLRAFVGERTRRLVDAAEKKANPEKAQPLSAGFFYNFSQKAAFSEDSDEINEMWSSLLADASEGHSYRHGIYADILSKLSASEAVFLERLCESSAHSTSTFLRSRDLKKVLYDQLRNEISWDVEADSESAQKELERFFNFDFRWPVSVERAFWPYQHVGERRSLSMFRLSEGDYDPFVAEVLCREGLLDSFEFDLLPGWSCPMMAGFHLTHLGSNFVTACQKR